MRTILLELADPNAHTDGTVQSDIWCAHCGPGSVSDRCIEMLDAGQCRILVDWWGDGVFDHPIEDYPAPEPFTSHGLKIVVAATGEVLHECPLTVSS